jgi:UDP-N-acetylglucosamine transferase subunit ALG13
MIFATVGTQLPFDRLILGLDQWAASNRDVEVFAQISHCGRQPEHIDWAREIEPQEFRRCLKQCDTVVAHAGMGTIISAVELGKRVIVMPRRASLGEHRNEHQLATASRLGHLSGLEVVQDSNSLELALARRTAWRHDVTFSEPHPQLIAAIRRFAGLRAA